MKEKYTLVATASFGLESVVAGELKGLGYKDLIVENGRVIFKGNEEDIVRCNLWLRVADRVLIKVSEFDGVDFDQLFQGTYDVPWEEMIPINGKIHVTGRSVKSKLASVRDCQSIVKKAIVQAMKRRYRKDWFEETGPLYRIEISLLADRATLLLDTTGEGLHKRGYRKDTGEAPLKETLAAGIILLSRWSIDVPLSDPMCGSGTIPIEAALLGRRMAPGRNRSFVSEGWPIIPKGLWDEMRFEAAQKVIRDNFTIIASDNNPSALRKAKENALRAGVADVIEFKKMDLAEFEPKEDGSFIITNPPYGIRMGMGQEVESVYRVLGRLYRRFPTCSMFILSAHPAFQRVFGIRADRNRKLYNGDVRCYLYEYRGAKKTKPPKSL
ncbi:MAG: class I SAM-dependent RNA methyltransferase [Syntrophorhabdaceae bacterium]|nr:class I SAM-dependent RNA methyltransferase [Syntrophorhabdaceae bacterium]